MRWKAKTQANKNTCWSIVYWFLSPPVNDQGAIFTWCKSYILLMEEILATSYQVVYPIIYRVLAPSLVVVNGISEPSTVSCHAINLGQPRNGDYLGWREFGRRQSSCPTWVDPRRANLCHTSGLCGTLAGWNGALVTLVRIGNPRGGDWKISQDECIQ